MATLDTVIIKITGDTKNITSTINDLKKLKTVDVENAKSFEKNSKKFQLAQKKNKASVGGLETAFNKLGPAILGAFAVGTIVNFAKELSRTASQMEAFERRAQVVFGNSIKIIEEFGKKNAISLGLSESAFKGAAAAVGDILVPLGLSRKRAAEMSVQAVKLGSALREFTGDQRSAAEISEIVAKSFTGEVEGLKGLGVVVNQNDKDFKALIKTKINVLGLTESQAKAEAIFETVLMRSTDALKSFETNSGSLARQQSELEAQSEELSETLATLLTPAFLGLTKAANESVSSLNSIIEAEGSLFEKFLALVDQTGLARLRLIALSATRRAAAGTTEEETEAEEEAIEVRKIAINTIGALKAELDTLRRAQDALIPGSKELAINQNRIKVIQALLKGEIIKTLSPIDLLNKRISTLKKELENQALAGNISTESIKAYKDALREASDAQVELTIALTDTLPFMDSAALKMDKISDIELIPLEEISKLEEFFEKHDALISTAIAAEQTLFNIIAQANTNRLIAIDSEEAAQLKALDAQGLGEEELAKRKLTIQQKSDQERAIILTKQAKADKVAAIIAATINTALAVTKALATANIALAVIVGALGAVEIGVIASQPIPTFHEGKKSELKEGEMFAKILKSEAVIPPEQSRKYKGAIDSMIDKKFESYVFQEYMLPLMKNMAKSQSSNPYDDIHIWNNQRKQIKLLAESNNLTRVMIKSMDSGHHRRSWR